MVNPESIPKEAKLTYKSMVFCECHPLTYCPRLLKVNSDKISHWYINTIVH